MAEFRLPFFAHGGDYNPDQWLDRPDILAEDLRLMKKAHVNIVSLGIFAWAALEPEEGLFRLDWMRQIIDQLHENGISVLLATPSGARPGWMSAKYPEVLRVENGRRNLHGGRHNHCFTSPVYRAFVTRMNTRLAQEFGAHPAVVGWHISNEYSGECHCELCQEAFRQWLKDKYRTLDNLNHAWWTAFWSKTFTDFRQIHSPQPHGEESLSGLTLDWRRFVSDQTRDFIRCEIAPIRRLTPDKPVTINTMGFHYGLDYASFADVVDFMGYDSYPEWGGQRDIDVALNTAFTFDFVRGFLNKNWSLMECTPSQVNWHSICKLKRPGQHMLSSMQALAHGSDTVMMFQWRKSRGGPEKFHGAVVGHDGTSDTRTFREVTQVGEMLETLRPLVGSQTHSEVAVIFDQVNRWALDGAQGPMRDKEYPEVVFSHYKALKTLGLNVDVIGSEKPLDAYRLVAAPYLYLIKPGVAEKLTRFVEAGGILVLTAFSGQVDENDLCFAGGAPGPLRALAGVWAEETDALYPADKNALVMAPDNALGLTGSYESGFICDYLRLEGATAQAVFASDYIASAPALTRKAHGRGETWYLATRPEQRFLHDFYAALIARAGIVPLAPETEDVLVCQRRKDGKAYTFFLNFHAAPVTARLSKGGVDLRTGQRAQEQLTLSAHSFAVIEED